MIDSTDKQRLDEAADELTTLLAEGDLAGVPCLIFANKQDLLGALTADAIMGELELTTFKDRSISVAACSAKLGEGLEEGLSKLIAVCADKAKRCAS